jgi:hypothetical protein
MVRNKLEVNHILDKVYLWSKDQDFKGYNKHDGLNSPILKTLLGWSKWPRIIAIQSVMRAPVNVRSLAGVRKTINPKGLALFCMGLLDRHEVDPKGGYLDDAEDIIERLYQSRSPGSWGGDCWGYSYPWQDPGFYAPAFTPNAVVTSFVCEALLAAYLVTGNRHYLKTVGNSIQFFLNDLPVLKDEADELCLGYMPLPMKMRVLDVSILVGTVIAQYAVFAKENELLETAHRLVNYVVHRQTEYHAWWYTDPPGDSLIRHDNYHTGFILDALWRYMKTTKDWQWLPNYEKGLAYYAGYLFNKDGSPRWMNDQDYPHDVHGTAQGLVSFSLAVKNGYPYESLLNKIGEWGVSNLYSQEGRFYYQRTRFYRKNFTLLRWCNAWMFRGLAASLACLRK